MILITIAGNVSAGGIKPENIDKLIKKEISYPDFAKQQKLEGIVLVNFTINLNGTISVNLTNESNTSLKDYVVAKLLQLKLIPTNDSLNKTYNVKFDFKFEK